MDQNLIKVADKKLGVITRVFLLALFLVLALFAASCAPTEKSCSVDDDCVPAACCHASEAVNKEFAPNCQNQLCTMVCVPGTLDCHQSEIKCLKSQCQVVGK